MRVAIAGGAAAHAPIVRRALDRADLVVDEPASADLVVYADGELEGEGEQRASHAAFRVVVASSANVTWSESCDAILLVPLDLAEARAVVATARELVAQRAVPSAIATTLAEKLREHAESLRDALAREETRRRSAAAPTYEIPANAAYLQVDDDETFRRTVAHEARRARRHRRRVVVLEPELCDDDALACALSISDVVLRKPDGTTRILAVDCTDERAERLRRELGGREHAAFE
jgi:hypothetical protein